MATVAERYDVILRDGSTLRLRPPVAADRDAVVAFFEALSPQSLYQRFHGRPALTPALVERFLDPDWRELGSLVGSIGEGADERIVALGSYARLRDPAAAEAAFSVADAYQRRGIGTRLLEQLAALAAEAGIERFVAEVRPENRQMLGVFAGAGFETRRELSGGTVEVQFPLQPTERFRTRVDERDHVAVVESLRPFFQPRSVAVLGASRKRGSIGGELFRNILESDFEGAAFPVNLRGEPVAGVRAYASVEEIPDEVDLAVICLPGDLVLDSAQAALRHGIRALCVISAGFAEIGKEGAARQERLLELVRAHGARLVGPNCLGIAVGRARMNATFASRPLPFGNIGFSSQSGALGLALLEAAAGRGLGLSAFVSIGNKADVSSNDLLEWWEDDEDTDVVLLYLESFGNPRKFARVGRRVARSKPILAMKSGTTRSGQRAASSHTAALAGSDTAVEALFRQAGVQRAATLEELVDAAVLFSSQPLPQGRRVAILTNAGGLGILCADACEGAGLELPSLAPGTETALAAILPREASLANPVDMLGSAAAESYAQALPVVLADPRVDAVIVLFVPPVTATSDEVAASIRAVLEPGADKPVLAVVMSSEGIPRALRGGGIAAFAYPESAARALGRAAERAEWLRRPAGVVPELGGIDREAAEALTAVGDAGDRWLGASEVRALLQAYGIPVVPERVVDSVDDAVAAARELGFPVVVKSARPGAHKTETGGVALDLRDEQAVREAAERIGSGPAPAPGEQAPALAGGSVEPTPLLLQPMLHGGAELLAGIVQDPTFGPLVAFGPGGTNAELIGGAAFRIAPLTRLDAEELVTGGKAGRLVAGWRGAPPADASAIGDLLLRLSQLADDVPQIAELDLNPVIAGPEGCVAVDARVRLRRPARATQRKTW
jgi:acetyl coenzyme A synthetase (ADP forming)-like protein